MNKGNPGNLGSVQNYGFGMGQHVQFNVGYSMGNLQSVLQRASAEYPDDEALNECKEKVDVLNKTICDAQARQTQNQCIHEHQEGPNGDSSPYDNGLLIGELIGQLQYARISNKDENYRNLIDHIFVPLNNLSSVLSCR
jgi:hypothetical protein